MRPRERLLKLGPGALNNEELLAIFLRNGTKTRNAIELAGDILRETGGIRNLLTININDLQKIKGLGPAKWAQLQGVYELVKRALEEELTSRSVIESPSALREYLQTAIGHLNHEVFSCLYLDSAYQLIHTDQLFRGTQTHTYVHPKEIAKEALRRSACAVIVAHNHPSGNPLPSQDDIALTERLIAALGLIDIDLLDHCILTKNDFFSFSNDPILSRKLNFVSSR
jgi:DNA repair protein RadC